MPHAGHTQATRRTRAGYTQGTCARHTRHMQDTHAGSRRHGAQCARAPPEGEHDVALVDNAAVHHARAAVVARPQLNLGHLDAAHSGVHGT